MSKSIQGPNHEGILSFGCGCNKARGTAVVAAAGRSTVYQVINPDTSVADEFTSLPEARAKAVAIGGRVKVTSKVIG